MSSHPGGNSCRKKTNMKPGRVKSRNSESNDFFLCEKSWKSNQPFVLICWFTNHDFRFSRGLLSPKWCQIDGKKVCKSEEPLRVWTLLLGECAGRESLIPKTEGWILFQLILLMGWHDKNLIRSSLIHQAARLRSTPPPPRVRPFSSTWLVDLKQDFGCDLLWLLSLWWTGWCFFLVVLGTFATKKHVIRKMNRYIHISCVYNDHIMI